MYDLHKLGWHSFQQLCLTICRQILGQTAASFLDTNDAGRDGAFAGTWSPAAGEVYSGQFVIQCKFTEKPGYTLKMADMAEEIEKARKLVASGLCDVYVLMTNAGLSAAMEARLRKLLEGAGVKHVVIRGSTWINDVIRENKQLRMHVPRMYGLGDLSQILDERAYTQARAVLESMRDDLAKVVITGSYRDAVTALDVHGFVLLIGEPAAGKTTIASMMAMAAADQWGAAVLKLDDPAKVVERWNPDEPSQFFWVDDAFGVMQYESTLAHSWNHILPHVRTMLAKGAKIVMTSRNYIYERARHDLKQGAFPLLNESQVVIDVQDLTPQERQQILYNHLKLGTQPASFRTEIKPLLPGVAAHARFIPEIARRLADPTYTKNLHLVAHHLDQFVEKREQLLQEVIHGLDTHSKAALALVYMRKDHLESPVALQPTEEDALQRLGSSLGQCRTALEALNDSLVLHQHADGESVWRFKHPTIGDAYSLTLAKSPELLGIFLLGSAPENLIEQVSCGKVGVERAVIVPKSLYPQMITRLDEFKTTSKYKSKHLSMWGAQWALHSFLTYRCSKEFLTLYLEKNPKLAQHVATPGISLSAVSEVSLAARLHEFGLLPECWRIKFVETVCDYAITGEDLYGLESDTIRSVFTDAEFEDLRGAVRTKLLPRLDHVRKDLERSFDHSETAEDYMQNLMESFDTLKATFKDDAEAVQLIEREVREAQGWIGENESDQPKVSTRTLGKTVDAGGTQGSRSIFDDVDA